MSSMSSTQPQAPSKLGEAIHLAADVHRYQVDKAGVAYILHPIEVMNRARAYYLANSDGWRIEDVMIVAILHDVLEDIKGKNPWDRKRLGDRIYAEFGDDVSSAVDALTKYTDHESYDEYLDRVARNWMARVVKIADLSHNLDAFRIPSAKILDKDFERWDKYHRALVRLMREERRH
jgi:(p)ppGpp synthase/HD superfamily hydrolase